MDPAFAVAQLEGELVELVYPTLLVLRYDPTTSSGMTLVPWAASALPTFSADGLTMTFHLRSGMTWSDGTPIDANGFAYSINRSLDPCTVLEGVRGLGPSFLTWLRGAVAFAQGVCPAGQQHALNPTSGQGLIGSAILIPDPLTLQLKLAAPAIWARWSLVTSPAMAVPQSLISRYGLQHWTDHLTDDKGFGGNVFNLSAWDHSGRMTFVANSSFWDSPKPTLQTIRFDFHRGNAAAHKAYLDGQDMLEFGLPPEDYASTAQHADLHESPQLTIAFTRPNWSKAPFDNPLARQAFDLALNKVALNQEVNGGAAFATNHMIPLGESDYNPHLVGPDGTQSLTGNLALAASDWQQYAAASCPGGQTAKCPPITLTTTNDDFSVKLANAEESQWQEVLGVSVNVEALPPIQFFPMVFLAPSAQQRPQMWSDGYLVDYPVGWDWTTFQASGGSNNDNLNGVNDQAANQLMARADTDQSPTQQAVDYQAAEQQLVRDVAWISLYQPYGYWLDTSKVYGFTLSPAGYWLPENMLQTYVVA
jgi:ABC-type oligopeptide transport system substrate-binding subunit